MWFHPRPPNLWHPNLACMRVLRLVFFIISMRRFLLTVAIFGFRFVLITWSVRTCYSCTPVFSRCLSSLINVNAAQTQQNNSAYLGLKTSRKLSYFESNLNVPTEERLDNFNCLSLPTWVGWRNLTFSEILFSHLKSDPHCFQLF